MRFAIVKYKFWVYILGGTIETGSHITHHRYNIIKDDWEILEKGPESSMYSTGVKLSRYIYIASTMAGM